MKPVIHTRILNKLGFTTGKIAKVLYTSQKNYVLQILYEKKLYLLKGYCIAFPPAAAMNENSIIEFTRAIDDFYQARFASHLCSNFCRPLDLDMVLEPSGMAFVEILLEGNGPQLKEIPYFITTNELYNWVRQSLEAHCILIQNGKYDLR